MLHEIQVQNMNTFLNEDSGMTGVSKMEQFPFKPFEYEQLPEQGMPDEFDHEMESESFGNI